MLGKVKWLLSNEPVGDMEVTLVGETGEFRTKTADDGTYLVLGVPAGEYYVDVSKPGRRYRRRPVHVSAGEYTDGCDFSERVNTQSFGWGNFCC